MVLFETCGLWLSSIVRGGIGWNRRLACLKHGPDLSDGYFSSKSSVSRTRRPPPGRIPRDGTDSQPEALNRGLPPLGQQSLIEIAERSSTAADSCCCTLKDIFEVVVVVLI